MGLPLPHHPMVYARQRRHMHGPVAVARQVVAHLAAHLAADLTVREHAYAHARPMVGLNLRRPCRMLKNLTAPLMGVLPNLAKINVLPRIRSDKPSIQPPSQVVQALLLLGLWELLLQWPLLLFSGCEDAGGISHKGDLQYRCGGGGSVNIWVKWAR